MKNNGFWSNVASLVTFAVVAVFVVMALRGDIEADAVMLIVTNVIAFYFGTQHEKRAEVK